MKKISIFLFAIGCLLLPVFASADMGISNFEARVIKILAQEESLAKDDSLVIRQDLLLRGIKGEWKGKEITSQNIGEIEFLSDQIYKEGDEVLVQRSIAPGGEEIFSVVEYVRRDWLYLLGALFALAAVGVGGWKGLRSLLSLLISFFLIIKFILPSILSGHDPFLVALAGGLLILASVIYLTEGLNRKSNLAMASVFFSLLITLGLSLLFTWLCRLSGLDEDVGSLMNLTSATINFRGLLLAGFLIGAIGVLDDVVIGQIEAVGQLKKANSLMSFKDLFKAGYKIGNTHLGSMINTLFLTYAGASLPLLLIFSLQDGSAVNFSQAINNEMIATEIVRTLVGSIGVALSMPIATAMGAKFLKLEEK